MELPPRAPDDRLLKPGEYRNLRARLRKVAPAHDVVTVVACAFDHRTRVLPFVGADLRMASAGVRAIGAAMVDSGFEKTRVVQQQWNKNFSPVEMRLDGRMPDLFLVSSMSVHSACGKQLVAEACRIDPAHRPLVVAGGPRSVYQPWDAFRTTPDEPAGADLVVTGEDFVWMSVLERLLADRGEGESLRDAFLRGRDRGYYDDIPGLCYARGEKDGVAGEIVDTGVQRLLGDLDELPDPVLGYRLLERPSRGRTLQAEPMPDKLVKKHSPIASLVLTYGCKFRCPYCPIPAYNQKTHRLKSPERIAHEMTTLYETFGFRLMFGTDDNFFNDHARTIDIVTELGRATVDGGKPIRKRVRWGTEATVHDALKLREHMSTIRGSGLRAIWMGVEDLTATFVKKGQNENNTIEAFEMLRYHGIHPMPMMMHHDGQPLYTRGKPYGLLNQAHMLRKAGAVSFQVLMMTPSTGSKLYEEAYNKGIAYESVNGKEIQPYMTDANYVIASEEDKPWRKQRNMLIAYLFFYNPLRWIWAFFFPKSRLYLADALAQMHGMWGLSKTIRRTLPWIWHLWRGKIVRHTKPPISNVPIVSPDGGRGSHALEAQAERDRVSV